MPVEQKQNSNYLPEIQEKITDTGWKIKAEQRIAAALSLAKRGFYLFPLRPNSKLPAIQGWQGVATTDAAQLRKWFGGKRAYNIGIATERSGLVVIDCDCKSVDGRENFVQMAGGIAPDTFTVETPSGGLHFYLKGDPVTSTASRLAPGVDVRSRGGLVVAPGSTIDGKPYRAISAAPAGRVPQWLTVAIAEAYAASEAEHRAAPAGVELDTPAAVDEARRYLADEAPPAIENSGGNETTLTVAAHVGDLGLTEAAAFDLMAEVYNPRCLPAWDEDDLAEIVGNSYRYRQNAIGCDTPEANFDIITDWDEPANDNPPPTDDSRLSDARRTLARATLDLAALAGTAPPPREWLVQDWVPADVVTLFYGDGGTGKSLAALQLAAAVATGEPWFGIPVKAGRALYITAEDDASELHRRLADIASEQGVGLAELVGKLDVLSLAADDPTLAHARGDGDLKFTKLWDALAAMIAELKPRLVVLDTLADVFAGNENVRAQARAFIGKLRKTGIDHGTNIVVLAHPSRDGLKVQGNSAAAGSSGSTAWHNSVRSRLVLERDDKTGLRTLHVAKANYGGVGASVQLRWYAGAFVLAGGTASQAETNAEADRVFLDMLDHYTAEGRRVGPNLGKTYAPSVFASDDRSGMFDSKSLADAMNRLFSTGVIRVIEDGPPSKRREHIARSEPATGPLAEAA